MGYRTLYGGTVWGYVGVHGTRVIGLPLWCMRGEPTIAVNLPRHIPGVVNDGTLMFIAIYTGGDTSCAMFHARLG